LVSVTVLVDVDHFTKFDIVTHEFVHVAVVYFDTHDTVVVFVVDFTVTLFQKATNA
jgi:hypothetical protein